MRLDVTSPLETMPLTVRETAVERTVERAVERAVIYEVREVHLQRRPDRAVGLKKKTVSCGLKAREGTVKVLGKVLSIKAVLRACHSCITARLRLHQACIKPASLCQDCIKAVLRLY